MNINAWLLCGWWAEDEDSHIFKHWQADITTWCHPPKNEHKN
jgi:hypothetical protein